MQKLQLHCSSISRAKKAVSQRKGGSHGATYMRLTEKVSIITGAGQGIGRATALKFASEGARVAVCDINQAAVDVTVKAIIARMVNGVMARWGRIDTLVNNAGIVQDAQFKKMTDEQFERVIDVNLKGVY